MAEFGILEGLFCFCRLLRVEQLSRVVRVSTSHDEVDDKSISIPVDRDD